MALVNTAEIFRNAYDGYITYIFEGEGRKVSIDTNINPVITNVIKKYIGRKPSSFDPRNMFGSVDSL